MITGHSPLAACVFEASVAVFRQGTCLSLIQNEAGEPSLRFVYYIELKLACRPPRVDHLSPENEVLNIHSQEMSASYYRQNYFLH